MTLEDKTARPDQGWDAELGRLGPRLGTPGYGELHSGCSSGHMADPTQVHYKFYSGRGHGASARP